MKEALAIHPPTPCPQPWWTSSVSKPITAAVDTVLLKFISWVTAADERAIGVDASLHAGVLSCTLVHVYGKQKHITDHSDNRTSALTRQKNVLATKPTTTRRRDSPVPKIDHIPDSVDVLPDVLQRDQPSSQPPDFPRFCKGRQPRPRSSPPELPVPAEPRPAGKPQRPPQRAPPAPSWPNEPGARMRTELRPPLRPNPSPWESRGAAAIQLHPLVAVPASSGSGLPARMRDVGGCPAMGM